MALTDRKTGTVARQRLRAIVGARAATVADRHGAAGRTANGGLDQGSKQHFMVVLEQQPSCGRHGSTSDEQGWIFWFLRNVVSTLGRFEVVTLSLSRSLLLTFFGSSIKLSK